MPPPFDPEAPPERPAPPARRSASSVTLPARAALAGAVLLRSALPLAPLALAGLAVQNGLPSGMARMQNVLQALQADQVAMGFTLVFLILSLGVHEAAHAWVALKCGDPTGRDLGRLTLNPIPHIDPVMSILVPLLLFFSGSGILFGGAKPVPVQFHRLRKPWRDMSLVALAGPGSNLLLAGLFMAAWHLLVNHLGYGVNDRQPVVLAGAALFNILLAVFNLFPVPPLDGSRVMAWLLPQSLREPYVSLERFGLFIVIGLVFFVPAFQRVLWEGMAFLFVLTDEVVSLGGLW